MEQRKKNVLWMVCSQFPSRGVSTVNFQHIKLKYLRQIHCETRSFTIIKVDILKVEMIHVYVANSSVSNVTVSGLYSA